MHCSEQISVKQSQVDKLYAGLKDLAGERRAKLDEALRLFQLSREVDDLEQWITERELVAGSQELGQDYDHVTVSCDALYQWCAALVENAIDICTVRFLSPDMQSTRLSVWFVLV